jgi:two-component system sensor histidine kinase KdpD
LTLQPTSTVDDGLLTPFLSAFDLRAVCLFDSDTMQLFSQGESESNLAEATRTAYITQRDIDDAERAFSTRLLRAGTLVLGAIGFEGLADPELTANPLTALATIAVEQRRAFAQAARSSAAAEAEVLRGAILDALAHELKTPLATIVMAAGGIREGGPLRAPQAELAHTVEEEATRLAQLTTRLLQLARLDKKEVKPHMEPNDITQLVGSLVAQYSRRCPDRHLSLLASDRVVVPVDRELLWLASAQLLDNACKYSPGASDIIVSLKEDRDRVVLRVWNSGTSIAAVDRTRIFHRFFRGTDARGIPGSGLGLYVARKIVVAHGGSLDLEQPSDRGDGIAFRLVLPHSHSELKHVAKSKCVAGR